MRPSHATKAGRRYRYYVSRLPEGAASESLAAWRIPAPALEETVLVGLCSFFGDGRRLAEALGVADFSSDRLQTIGANAVHLGRRLRDTGPAERRDIFVELIARIDVRQDRLSIALHAKPLWALLGETLAERTVTDDTLRLDISVRHKRRGVETKLVLPDERLGAALPDPNLIAAVMQGYRWFEEIRNGAVSSVDGLVRRHGVDQGDVSRILPLAFLAPDIVEAILQGRQPVELTAARLKRMRLPLSWVEQRLLLGFTG